MSTIFTLQERVEKKTGAEIIRSVKIFFGIKVRATYKRSRIIRKPSKTYEEFIFKGYNLQQAGISKPNSFRKLRFIGKN